MITLEYLEELGKFTVDLIENLKVQTSNSKLRNTIVIVNDSGIRFTVFEKIAVYIISENLDESFVISVNQRTAKLTFVKVDSIISCAPLKKYSTESLEEDWFSLMTVLSDEELIEMYLLRTVQDMMINTNSNLRILLNPHQIHEYYLSLQEKV